MANLPAMPKVEVETEGSRIILNFEDLAAVLRVFSQWGSPSKQTDFTRRLEETMRLMGLDLEVRVQGKVLDLFGPNGESGLLRRLIQKQSPA
jgi:hypothetical protein